MAVTANGYNESGTSIRKSNNGDDAASSRCGQETRSKGYAKSLTHRDLLHHLLVSPLHHQLRDGVLSAVQSKRCSHELLHYPVASELSWQPVTLRLPSEGLSRSAQKFHVEAPFPAQRREVEYGQRNTRTRLARRITKTISETIDRSAPIEGPEIEFIASGNVQKLILFLFTYLIIFFLFSNDK